MKQKTRLFFYISLFCSFAVLFIFNNCGQNDKKQKWVGINVFTGKMMDSWTEGVIEPLKIKTQALSSATEVAEMILRIDDVIFGGSGADAPPNQPHNSM